MAREGGIAGSAAFDAARPDHVTADDPRVDGHARAATRVPRLVELDDARALDASLTGGKAAALARARAAGVPTLDGFVLTTAFTADRDGGLAVAAAAPDLHVAWRKLTRDARTPLVARSSSTIEDQSRSSMAGQFETVLDLATWESFLDAVDRVVASRARLTPPGEPPAPLAVLVQPMLSPTASGVRFGVDPVTGRSDRRVVESVAGQGERLVSGRARPNRYVTDPSGALVSRERGEDGGDLTSRQLGEVAALGRQVDTVFGGPQDVEFAIDRHGDAVLLQSRPVTTEVRGVPRGPLLGAGPVAETFPEPLRPLERDLWLPPLRDAVSRVLLLTGAASPREVAASPLVTHVDGTVVVDLEAFGAVPPRRRGLQRLSPWLHRIRASWRVGRLRHALPTLDLHLLRRIDALLGAVPPLEELTDRQLLAVIERGRDALRSLHGHEILTGALVDPDAPRLTAAAVALRTLSSTRGSEDDETIVGRHPVLLALTPPAVGRPVRLPRNAEAPELVERTAGGVDDTDRGAVLREALRLRIRWVQELTGRAAWDLARRLAADGRLASPDDVVELSLEDLHAVVSARGCAFPCHAPAVDRDHPAERLPTRFRLSDLGRPIAETDGTGTGQGAGGGTGEGPVTHRSDDPPDGSVLVVQNLDPALGGVLHRLAGLVAESGSPLSHAAILAREAAVATVVGHAGALDQFPEGAVVRVDGIEGAVEVLSPAPDSPTGAGDGRSPEATT